jgi:tetratricopeptide (TPR) repeat protein
MMLWVREQIPDTRNHTVVGLLPVAIRNPVAYATVVRPFLPGQELEPWTAGFRILLRDDRSAPMLVPHVAREASDWLIVYEDLDLSPETLAQSLVEQTADREAPEEQRVVAMVQLAALDFSHRRYAEALRKWGALFDYYDRKDVAQMKALCLGGAADVLRATGKLREAKEKYQQGLAYTKNVEHMPVMLNLLLGVGETCIGLQHWEEAEGYLHLAEQIADATRLLHPRCDVMARRGLALLALGRFGDAFSVWRACADVAGVLGYHARGAEALRGLIELRRRAGMSGEVRKLEDELRAVEHDARAGRGEAHA